jgi:hypothetical protein
MGAQIAGRDVVFDGMDRGEATEMAGFGIDFQKLLTEQRSRWRIKSIDARRVCQVGSEAGHILCSSAAVALENTSQEVHR